MTFTRANAPGWAMYEVLTSTQMNHVDVNQSRAIDGYAGGTYSPSAVITINQQFVADATSLGGNAYGIGGQGVGSGSGVVGNGGATGAGVNGSGLPGVEGIATVSGGNGVEGTGLGSGSGVYGEGGASNGIGVNGLGVGSGAGVHGQGGSGGAAGVTGQGAGNNAGVTGTGGSGGSSAHGVSGIGGSSGGSGLYGQGNSTGHGVQGVAGGAGQSAGVVCNPGGDGAALRFVPSGDTPADPQHGDVWLVGSVLSIYLGGSTFTFDLTAA